MNAFLDKRFCIKLKYIIMIFIKGIPNIYTTDLIFSSIPVVHVLWGLTLNQETENKYKEHLDLDLVV